VFESVSSEPARVRRAPPSRPLWIAAAALFALVLWGGYGQKWTWTGFSENDHLWDWLELLLLPLAVATLPLALTRDKGLRDRAKQVLLVVAVAFAVLVVLGYAFQMQWTGFPDNHLWDWLTLLVLPLTLAGMPFWRDLLGEVRPWPRVLGLAILGAFTVVVIGGYAWNWTWTGFDDNKLWDWIHLLLAPVLLPTILLPAALAWLATERSDTETSPEAAVDDLRS
jgi:uncharacterized membrane protein